MKRYKELLVFDFETTGLSYEKDNILEVGAIKYELINGKYQIVAEVEEILKTIVPVSEVITNLTGITVDMQEELGITQEEGFAKLSKLITDETLLVAYNIQFDLGFLTSFYRNNGYPNYEVKNNIMDVMAIYKDRHKFPWKLEAALEKYNVLLPNTHRALDDVKATYGLLKVLAEEKNNITKYVNVVGYNAKYGVSGIKLPHVEYVPQRGGQSEIDNK